MSVNKKVKTEKPKHVKQYLSIFVCLFIIGTFIMIGSITSDKSLFNKNGLLAATGIDESQPVLSLDTESTTISHRKDTMTVYLNIENNQSVLQFFQVHIKYDTTLFKYNSQATIQARGNMEPDDLFMGGFDVIALPGGQGLIDIGGMDTSSSTVKESGLLGFIVFDILATTSGEGMFEINEAILPAVPVENCFGLTVNLVFADILELDTEQPNSNLLKFINANGSPADRGSNYTYNPAQPHYVTGIARAIPLSQIKDQFKYDGDNIAIKFLNSGGAEITNLASNLATGQSIALYNGTDVLDKVIIVLKGDTTGDGSLNLVDAQTLFNHMNGSAPVTDVARLLAMRVRSTPETMHGAQDISRIYSHIYMLNSIDIYTGCFGHVPNIAS